LRPIIISWVRPNGYEYILTIGRELWFINFDQFTRGKRLREGEEEKLVEGKNLGAKLKPRI